MNSIDELESARIEIQDRLEGSRSLKEKRRLGLFATPAKLAEEITNCSVSFQPKHRKVRFLGPAFGTGPFYSALLKILPSYRIEWALGFEVDTEYGQEARKLWDSTGLKVRTEDFTKAQPPASSRGKANLIISNPPYIRHHYLEQDEKLRLQELTTRYAGVSLNGFSGLHAHFMLMTHAWLATNGIACWLVPGEILDVGYGEGLRRYLLEKVMLLRIHRFAPEDIQFDSALVSSVIILYRKRTPPRNHSFTFSQGGTLENPRDSSEVKVESLDPSMKWRNAVDPFLVDDSSKLCIGDLFKIKRGLATGANNYFLLDTERIAKEGIPAKFLIPIFPSPRYVESDRIQADSNGHPIIGKKLYLLSCDSSEKQVRSRFPSLWSYIKIGKKKGLHRRTLCRKRRPWYVQEKRPAPPILIRYMTRANKRTKRVFRFILNQSMATASNAYLLLYFKDWLAQAVNDDRCLVEQIWEELNRIPQHVLKSKARIYGGGMYKFEPSELAQVPTGHNMEKLVARIGFPDSDSSRQD